MKFGLYQTHTTEPLFNAEQEGWETCEDGDTPSQDGSWHCLQRAKDSTCKEECLAAFVESSAEVRHINELGFIRHQKSGVKERVSTLPGLLFLTLLGNDERNIEREF